MLANAICFIYLDWFDFDFGGLFCCLVLDWFWFWDTPGRTQVIIPSRAKGPCYAEIKPRLISERHSPYLLYYKYDLLKKETLNIKKKERSLLSRNCN